MTQELPLYQSHKRVRAMKLRSVELSGDGTGKLWPNDTNYDTILVDAAYMTKHQPVAGGYYVLYDDGYASWSPAQAFEEGYTRVE